MVARGAPFLPLWANESLCTFVWVDTFAESHWDMPWLLVAPIMIITWVRLDHDFLCLL